MQGFKNIWTAVAASLVALTGAAHAQDAYWQNDCCDYAYTRPVRPVVSPECGNWWIDGEALYWKTCETSVPVGTKTTTETVAGTAVTEQKVKVEGLDFEWDWGFRIGAGYNMPGDGWDLAAYWTHFNSTTNKHLNDDSGVINPFYAIYLDDLEDGVVGIRSRLKVNMNLVDVELGREFYLSRSVTLRPFIGARGAWIQQKLHTNSWVDTDVTDVFTLEDDHLKNNYAGAGVRAGLGSEWSVGCGLSLFGEFAVSLLYGEHTVHYTASEYTVTGDASDFSFSSSSSSSVSDPSDGVLLDRSYLKDDFCACRAVTDLALGLRWKYFFDCDSSMLSVQLGWEQHKFFSMNHFEFLDEPGIAGESSLVDRGDLCFQGVTLSARYEF